MVLLTSHLISGQRMGIDIPFNSLVEHPILIEDTVSPGYADISEIKCWWKFKDVTYPQRDYLFVRKEIKSLINKRGIESTLSTISDPPVSHSEGDSHYIDPEGTATGEWAGYEGFIATSDGSNWIKEPPCHPGYRVLDDEEKDIAAHYKIGSQFDHFADYSVPGISDYGLDYHKNSIIARSERKLRAVAEFYNRLPGYASVVLTDLIRNPIGDLTELYEEWGIKGTLEDYNIDFNPTPTPGIVDYCLGRAPFNGAEPFLSAGYPVGLLLKGWTPVDTDITTFCDQIYDILVNGVWDTSG